MTCAEFQRVLPDVIGDARNAEQEAHLKSCPACSGLLSDFTVIAQECRLLRGSEEPNARVWESIRAALELWAAELNAISEKARTLQASDEPDQRVWRSIEATMERWESEMDAIVDQAQQLQAADEPSPRVWNSIEIALRQEGLIRKPETPALAPQRRLWWNPAWLVPATAIIVLTIGLMMQHPGKPGSSAKNSVQTPTPTPSKPDDDTQVVMALAARTPALRAKYETDMKNLNTYIKDAESSLAANPNDEMAQQSVIDAYEQKQAVYEMAMDRALP
jgi:hypothetical protein